MIPLERFMVQLVAQRGDRYVWAAEASPLDPDPERFDCSELIQWAGARAGVSPAIPDGSGNQWNHVRRHGRVLPVHQGVLTRGALLWHPGHVAIALGDGTTIEARGRRYGVGTWGASGRFTGTGLFPGIDYTVAHPRGGGPGGAPITLRRGSHGAAVADLQTKLRALSSKPARIDGVFGPATESAVRDFQAYFRLAADGVVGPRTWGVIEYCLAARKR